MTGLVSTTFAMEEEDDGPRPPVRTWVMDVDVDVAGGGWDESCPGCGGRDPEASAATPAAPRPRPDPADPEDPEEEGFTLEKEEEDGLLDFPGIAEGESTSPPSSPEEGEEEVRGIRVKTRRGVPKPPTGGRLGHLEASCGSLRSLRGQMPQL